MIDELVFRIIFVTLWAAFVATLTWVRYSTGRTSTKTSAGRTLADRTARPEGRTHLVVLSLVAPFWLGGILFYLFLPGWIAVLSIPLPDWLRLAMAGVAAASLAFTAWGYRTLGRNWVHALEPSTFQQREGGALVTSGPYRFVRNPIYLGASTLLIAVALEAANWLIVLPSLVISVVLYLEVGNEETMLIDRFGDAYREYMKRTPRFIPRVGHHRRSEQREQPPTP